MPRVSIVIPCYNLGAYVREAVDSALAQTCDDCEIIVVDDGSTDRATAEIIDTLSHPRLRVLRTTNQGLASARNNGISIANGEIILPLDADDAIDPTYVEKALRILDGNDAIGIVYCRAFLFGAVQGESRLPECEPQNMVLRNYIFQGGLFRKTDWEAVGGYRPAMKYGWEDWDFWISLLDLGKQVHQIKEPLYRYRIRESSMARSMTKAQMIEMHTELFQYHKDFFAKNAQVFLREYYDRSNRTIPSLLREKLRHPLQTIRRRFFLKKPLI